MINLKNNFKKAIVPVIAGAYFLVAQSNPVYALDWDDKNWKEYGCPENIMGSWISRDKDNRLMIEEKR
jgi:hypothetical protein